MPVTPVAPLAPLEFHDASADVGPQGDVFQRRYTTVFYGCWPATASQAVVLASTGYAINQAHPDDARAYVSSISANNPVRTNVGGVDAFQWTITIGYATVVGNQVVGGPLQQPARISRSARTEEIVLSETYDGTPVLNTAGCPYNPPLTDIKVISKYRIMKNVSGFDFHALDDLVNKTNDAAWQGFDAKTLKVLPFDVPEKEHDEGSGQDYYPLVIEMEHDPDTWTARIPNLSFFQLVNGQLVRIMDAKGEERTDPTLLDANGAALAYPLTEDSEIIINEYERNEPVSFSPFAMLGTLNFPTA